jgi:hypothetical protein
VKRSILQSAFFCLGLFVLFGVASLVLANPVLRAVLSVALILISLALVIALFAWVMRKLWRLSARAALAMTSGEGRDRRR